MTLEFLGEALRDARLSGKVVTVPLAGGMQVRLAADPDRVALLCIGSAPSDADAKTVAAALSWTDTEIREWPLEGRAPGLLITPRPPQSEDTPPWTEPERAAHPQPAPPFCPGKPFPGLDHLRLHQLYHLTHSGMVYTLSKRSVTLDVQWRSLQGDAYGTTWRSFEQHCQNPTLHLATQLD